MYDLALLRDGGKFALDASQPTRIALIHTSERMALRRRGGGAHRFASHFPGLGLLNLAHSLRLDAAAGQLKPPVEIRYFDEESFLKEDEFFTTLRDWAGAAARPILAASTYTWTIAYLEALLARFDPERFLIIVGGPHATLAPDIGPAHFVVRGEGRRAFRHVVNEALTPDFGNSPNAAGICYQLDGKAVIQKQAFDRSLEELPSPGFAYDLLPPPAEAGHIYSANVKRLLAEFPQIYICTQSCRARCTFCSTYLIHGKSVARPVEKVRADLHYLIRERGYGSLEFHDDDLLQHPEFPALLEVLKELGVPWFCYARVPPIDEAVARSMAEAGCRRVFLGVESLDQQTLDYFNKDATVEQNIRAIHALDSAGVGVVAGFVIGAPHHTVESILRDLDAYMELPLLFLNNSILSPDPGTVEYHRARQRGGIFPAAFGGQSGMRLMPDPETFGKAAPMGLPTVCEGVSKEDLNFLLTLIEAEFYLRDSQWRKFESMMDARQMVRVAEYYDYIHEEVGRHTFKGAHPEIVKRWNQFLGRLENTEVRRQWMARQPPPPVTGRATPALHTS
jgi:anaerobic magnesium-protoporphyrin IX monomethyl ester cyclase